jgi:L-aspartate oxidase
MQKYIDFVVIGSGIAGLNTALTLASYGQVLIITKKKITDAATQYAQGGIAAVTNNKDSFNAHIQDTVQAGYLHNDLEAVSFLAKEGPKAIEKLVHFGVPFDRKNNGSFATSFEAAHSFPRILHASDFTGRNIEKTLVTKTLANQSIEIWEYTYAIDVITSNNTCFGVQVIKNGTIISIFSKATVLATGGIGQLYQWTTNPSVATGDGIAMAYRAGVKLADLEFIQFHPTALKNHSSPLFLLSEAIRGEGARLIDHKGKQFMKTIHPQKELAPRDVVTRAVFQKQSEGNVYLDIRHKSKSFIVHRFPNIYKELLKRGFDITSDPIPITPAAHFLCGGIITNLQGKTSVENLFEYGEVARTGVHGANRLASNSLLEGIVFSSQIANCIGNIPDRIRNSPTKRYRYADKKPLSIKSYRHTIQKIMWKYVGIQRSQKGLLSAIEIFQHMKKEIQKITEIHEEILEVKNMIETACLIASFAYRRKKSLGTHYVIE